ncbi:unnamed protein product [Urochloa decumbens]|uniref:KIB1-4 beta-propeller domain-containing protein n=1 Tax=Urochloa decumbens TaxID=240449 RepID=A0ABC8WEI4_9POAL
MADASGIPDWSSLPRDLLIAVLGWLDAPSALAYAGVCAPWRAAVAAGAGVPLALTPWLFSWEPDDGTMSGPPTGAMLRCVLGAGSASFPTAPFPRGRSVRCCGASHGWILASDEQSNLVLYNPFAGPSAANFIPLPPVTDFKCVRPGYSSDDEGRIETYVHEEYCGWDAESFGSDFYHKAVLSCAPSSTGTGGAGFTAAKIHCQRRSLSFAKAGDSEWRQACTMGRTGYKVLRHIIEDGQQITLNTDLDDKYSDITHHDGRFYTVTVHGVVESWDLSGSSVEVIGTLGYVADDVLLLSRHLVSTPWGDLLQVRATMAKNLDKYPQRVMVQIGKIIPHRHRMVKLRPAKALRGHAVFLGLNHSACVHPDEFPGLRRNCIYFTTPPFADGDHPWNLGWNGMKIYDMKNNMAEDVFESSTDIYAMYPRPPSVWVIPNRNQADKACCSSLMNLSLGD